MLKPAVVAHIGYTQQIRADFIAMANGMACGAMCGEGVAAIITDVNCRRLLIICLGIDCLRMAPVAEPISNHVRQEPRIICSGVAHPLASRFIAYHHAGGMAVAIIWIGLGVKAQ